MNTIGLKKHLFLLVVLICLGGLLGCAAQEQEGTGGTDGMQSEGEVTVPAAAGDESAAANEDSGDAAGEPDEELKTEYPLTVTDSTGTELTFESAPQRIASTSPAETEILFALGLGDRVVAVSDYCDYPEEAQSKPKLGSVVKPNVEALLAAEPDLVIGGISMDGEPVGHIRELGLKLYKTEPKSVEDVIQNVLTIGKITDRQKEAEALAAEMRADIEKVTTAVSDLAPEEKKRVYIEFSPGWTVGKGEFMHELLVLAGGINIAEELEGWNKIDEEKIIEDNPQVILYAEGVTVGDEGKPLKDIIAERSGWSAIEAIQQGELHGLDKDVLSRPGPRITQGLLEMARAIYPDRVN